ncbi:formate transporter [Carboxydocella sporoproducens DSM 16521]|uniref:Formate transporter n=2 Tax=Carboxydocella TaxID=178898 RepID=A0A1T4M777_9FIRM|nr:MULTISPECIES: formate/nitrite family transporter [Carboxydocella]AVX21024.1 formate transporter [Carboxydocella thermautotrophica]AVX31444.1 formate transporter [Carboxydocella thermautotrophica]SJZ62574.1 formate transporter [Carboxydocella sporoproducens DSM 16521]
MADHPKLSVDILTPDAVTEKAESIGVKKAKNSLRSTVMLGILAGAFIALAGEFYTMAVFQAETGYSISRLLGGLAFSLGLILVVITGAELFTGNTLLVIAYMTRKITLRDLLRNWVLVYIGNFIGAFGVALLVYYSQQYAVKDHFFAVESLKIAFGKLKYDFLTQVIRGTLANMLVVLAVWLTYAGRTLSDKLLAIIFPITAFVASGFEHSIANMYFLPFAWLVKHVPAVQSAWQVAGAPGDLASLTWATMFWKNIIPVTIGNIIGGAVFVGLAYWFVYLYKRV